jgi:hypothetical protein
MKVRICDGYMRAICFFFQHFQRLVQWVGVSDLDRIMYHTYDSLANPEMPIFFILKCLYSSS